MAPTGTAPKGMVPAALSCCGSFEKRVIRIAEWLKTIYGNAPVPIYEVNKRTVDILHEVMKCNKESDKDVSLLIEDINDQAAKYEAEAQYWQDILKEGLGLSVSSLSQEATQALTYLVESAVALEAEDTSLTSFYCAINDMTSELLETKSKTQEMELKLKTLTEKLTSALMMKEKLEKDMEETVESQAAEIAKAQSRSKNLKFLRDKSLDIKIRIKDAECKLLDAGLDRSLTHEALVTFSEEVAALQEGLLPLKKEVKSYHNLPPNIALARVKVEEARNKLNTLEDELVRLCEAVPFELM